MATGPGVPEGTGDGQMNEGDVWTFLFSMVALLCMVIWYDIRKEKRRKQ